jgi:hypothetical protein
MQEPKSYYSSNEAIKFPTAAPPEMQQPVLEADLLVAWDQFTFQQQTDMRLWMTHGKKSRMKKAAWWAATPQDEDKGIDPRKQVKMLFTIMFAERLHPHGERDVAAIAFNALFPKGDQDAS